MNDFPIDTFSFQILEICDPKDLDWKEEYWIKYFKADKYGYNQISGGQHNSGESNPKAKLTSQDVYDIREMYNKHMDPQEVYNMYYNGKIALTYFYRIWEGASWPNIHMDVYNEYNKKMNKMKENSIKNKTNFTDDEIMMFRNRYINETAEEIYSSLNLNCKLSTFKGILQGESYKHLPYYHKKKKTWYNC